MWRKITSQALLVTAAFAGGAITTELSHAEGEQESPYGPLAQMARVMVFVENSYVDPVDRDDVLNGAVKGIVAELDPHSAYMTPKEFTQFNEDTEGTFGGIGVEVDFKGETIVVIAPIEGSPAFEAGVKSGDEIVAVDNKPLRDMPVDKIIKMMRGPAGSKVTITIRRKGEEEPLIFTLEREHIHVRSCEGLRMDNDIGYLRLKQFQQGSHRELLEEVGKLRKAAKTPLRGLILDLRSNPGGLVDEAEGIADEFLDGGAIYSTRHRGAVVDLIEAHGGGAVAKEPLVVLVNEYSASSSELVAGALQDNGRGVMMGGRTFGKGSVQTIFQLPGGAGIRLTTMRYYTPKGSAIQANGIWPDVLIRYAEDEKTGAKAIREGDLEGHLPPEQVAKRKNTRVLEGDERPDYTPVNKLPHDPRKSKDFALQKAYEELLTRPRP